MTVPKEIVIISGKGGTGKTSVAAGFWDLAEGGVFCDCDVDAANLELVLGAEELDRHEFIASQKPEVNTSRCAGCGLCRDVCRFGSVPEPGKILGSSCEGCGLCARVCPAKAIEMKPVVSGCWRVSETERGPLVHARLEPGEENSGKLVTFVRQKARALAASSGRGVIVTDGPPGIGCPVIASLSGAGAALVVTEPTLSGIHDLERVVEVCRRFEVPVMVCVNKCDVHEGNRLLIENRCRQEGIEVAGAIPFDDSVPKAMMKGLPVTRYPCPAAKSIRSLWDSVTGFLHL